MIDEEDRSAVARSSARRVVYCVVPATLAPKLHDELRDYFRDEPAVEVIVERRGGERRRRAERRQAEPAQPEKQGPAAEVEEAALDHDPERRRIRSQTGRRIGERRVEPIELAEPPPLPRRARRHADQLRFFVRLEPHGIEEEDRETARLVTRFQAGDAEAFSAVYTRYFDRVYAYLRTALRHSDEAEDLAQQVFMQVFEALPRFEQRGRPFRSWLFSVARNRAIDHLRKHGRVESVEPDELERRREHAPDPGGIAILDWISDRDLLLFVERLPLAQRQVLLLRFVFGFTGAEIARTLERSEVDVRALQHRALRYLEDRLRAVRHRPASRDRARIKGARRLAPVARSRRFVLLSPW